MQKKVTNQIFEFLSRSWDSVIFLFLCCVVCDRVAAKLNATRGHLYEESKCKISAPLASKLREEKEVTKGGGTDGQKLFKNLLCLCRAYASSDLRSGIFHCTRTQGIKKFVAQSWRVCIFQHAKNACLLNGKVILVIVTYSLYVISTFLRSSNYWARSRATDLSWFQTTL